MDWMLRDWLLQRLELRATYIRQGCNGANWRTNNCIMAQYLDRLGGMASAW